MTHETDSNLFEECSRCQKTKMVNELKTEKGYWKAQHKKAREDSDVKDKRIQQLEALIKQLQHQLYSRKTEKQHPQSEKTESPEKPIGIEKRKRGAQKGTEGHGRRDYSHLEKHTEHYRLQPDQQICLLCGKILRELPTTEDSEVLETKTIVYVRKIKRHKYANTCLCPQRIINAPVPAKLIPKSKIGISIWVEILIAKFSLGIPVNRKLKEFATRGLPLAPGTIGDGLKRIAGYFEPIYEALEKRLIEGDFFQADETRWSVFVTKEDKLTFKWYLWVFIGKESVVHVIDPSRSTRVIEEHLGSVVAGILVVDRYSAYKSFVKKHEGIKLAFCWAHVRRDFIDAGMKYPKLKDWADGWVLRIAGLYHINNQRVLADAGSQEFNRLNGELKKSLQAMQVQNENELAEKNLHFGKEQALQSLANHWDGLCVFADNPHVPMDNNKSERTLRNSVIGRKNYYGSGSEWSSALAACCFSIFETLKLWKKNEREWLETYLTACALNKGQAPASVEMYLPWYEPNKKPAEKAAHETEKNIVPKKIKKSPLIPFTDRTEPQQTLQLKAGELSPLVFKQPQSKTELDLWNEYIERHHYLGYSPLPGKNLRYFVSSGDKLLALLGFNSAAFKVKARDDFIGWDNELRTKNLDYVVNNSRFLILPWVSCENLASRILATSSRNLLADWCQLYGYKPVMLETFVDSERFNGACYKTANWIYVGKTTGRGKLDRDHTAVLSKKFIFVFPLIKKFKNLLC